MTAAGDFAIWFGETSLAVSLLIIAILLVRRPVARHFGPEAAYLLWLAPLFRLATPELGILPASWREEAASEFSATWTAAAVAFETGAAAAPATAAISMPLVLAAVWLIGALVFLGLQLGAQRRFMKALERGSAAPSVEVAAEAAVIAERCGLKSSPRILVSSDKVGPLVAGALGPVVILPADFETAYSSVERQLALSHEFAHIRRGDLFTTFAAIVFRAAQWPNPLVHYAFEAFRADQEAACDASVLATNASFPNISYAYGAAIVKAAASRCATPAASLAMSNHLKERLMLMKSARKTGSAAGRALAAALIIAGVGASASYSYAADETAPKKKEKVIKTEKKSSSSVSVIRVDGDEKLKIDGIKGAHKIEVRNEDGQRTVKVWDKDGVLVSENTYGAGDKMPFETIAIIDADGKTQTIDISRAPETPGAFAWASADDAPGEKRKIMIFKGDGDHPMDIDCADGGGALIDIDEDTTSVGGSSARKSVVCIASAGGENDPAARAEALKKAIAHMELQAAEEEKRRREVIAKLRAELAKAESETKKKK